jgi:hypothetical protein
VCLLGSWRADWRRHLSVDLAVTLNIRFAIVTSGCHVSFLAFRRPQTHDCQSHHAPGARSAGRAVGPGVRRDQGMFRQLEPRPHGSISSSCFTTVST